MKRFFLFFIIWIAGSLAMPLLIQKVLWFLPEMVDPNPSEFLWVGECGNLVERPVLLRYPGKTGDFPVEVGAIRKDFDRDDCAKCYQGDLGYLRPLVQKKGKYKDLFLEQEGEGRFKLRMLEDDPGEPEMIFHYKCGKNGIRPIWSASEIFGIPVPEYGGKALTWTLGAWTLLVFVGFLFRRRKRR